jgi:hypothetical protein
MSSSCVLLPPGERGVWILAMAGCGDVMVEAEASPCTIASRVAPAPVEVSWTGDFSIIAAVFDGDAATNAELACDGEMPSLVFIFGSGQGPSTLDLGDFAGATLQVDAEDDSGRTWFADVEEVGATRCELDSPGG